MIVLGKNGRVTAWAPIFILAWATTSLFALEERVANETLSVPTIPQRFGFQTENAFGMDL